MTKHEDVGLHSVKMGTDETVEDSEFSPLRLLNHSGLETDSHFEKPDPGCSKRVKCSTKQEPHEEEHRDVSFEDRKRWENGLRSITTGERKSGLSCPRRAFLTPARFALASKPGPSPESQYSRIIHTRQEIFLQKKGRGVLATRPRDAKVPRAVV